MGVKPVVYIAAAMLEEPPPPVPRLPTVQLPVSETGVDIVAVVDWDIVPPVCRLVKTMLPMAFGEVPGKRDAAQKYGTFAAGTIVEVNPVPVLIPAARLPLPGEVRVAPAEPFDVAK